MTTRRWGITIVVVAAVIAGSIGLAAANDGSTGQVPGSMMGTAGSMMGGTDMGVMHDQMMSAMAGTVPAAMLARCDKLHDRMWSATGNTTAVAGHASHHTGPSG